MHCVAGVPSAQSAGSGEHQPQSSDASGGLRQLAQSGYCAHVSARTARPAASARPSARAWAFIFA